MGRSSSFQNELTFEQRLGESREIVAKYPDRIPVIVERYSKCDLPELEKKKYLVPRDLSVGHFIHILSSRLIAPRNFLYMYYSTEKTFGSCT
ncbi:hypothetical protein P8452_03885 [Trifolium repens]|nr:hypothetical protein P8452_03885 [Trifolium repens]